MKRLVFALALCSTPALAQLAITPNSECGALAVGRNAVTGVIVTYDPVNAGLSQRVGADGVWVGCVIPPPPLTCKQTKLMPWSDSKPGVVGRNFCYPTSANLPARKEGVTATVIGTRLGVPSDTRGVQTWRCTANGWRVAKSYCQ